MPLYDYQGNQISWGGGDAGYDWTDKKITFEGDSITANGGIGYPAYIASQLGTTSNVIAISGVPVYGNYPTNYYDFRKRVSNIPADTDAIVILGDTNAYGSGLASTEYFSTSTDSWMGRWNLAIDAIKKSFPTVPLFLVACFRQKTKEDNAKYVAHFFRRLAQHYGCIFVDLSTESSLNLLYSSSVWGLQATDGTHPSKAAMPLFANVILKHIRSIPPYSFTGTSAITIDASKTVAVGSTVDIDYTVTGDLSVQWTSSDMDVACVMGGTVYGMGAGAATITATTRNGQTATCAVTVTASE